MRNLIRKEQGFTLIELLIVLAILGILVGIVAMSVSDLNDTAKTRGMESEKEIIQTAIDTYNTQDVTVEQADSIPSQENWTKISVQADPDNLVAPFFNKYIKRQTKYYFKWGSGGVDLKVNDDDDAADEGM